ncbi:MAG: glycosyltransferase family 39 protein [Oceanipulchritudo sp.]
MTGTAFGRFKEAVFRKEGWPGLSIPVLCFAMAGAGYILPPQWKAELVAKTALPVCLLVIVSILLSGWTGLRGTNLLKVFRRNLPVAILGGIFVLLYSVLDHRDSKVILDELILQTSALHLTEDNEYRIPQFAHNLNSEFSFQLGWGVPDKRPPMFPVLLSTVHRLLGYSQNNGYILNAILGFGLFMVVGKIGEFLYPRYGGFLAILALGSMPLVSQNITSQHLEILYLFLIALLFWISLRSTLRKSEREIPLAYLLAAAIALTRYEGLIFFMVPFFLHLHAVLERRPVEGLKRVFLVCPLAVAFIFALLGHVFNYAEFWQLDDMNNTQAFGAGYWTRNAGSLLDFMLQTNRELPGSLALSVLGLASIPISLIHIGKGSFSAFRHGKGTDGELLPIGIFFLCGMFFLALIFSYHWGNVNSHVTARFVLFPYLVMLAMILYSLKHEPFWLMLIGTVLAVLGGLQTVVVDGDSVGFSYALVLAGLSYGAILCLKKGNLIKLGPALVVFWCLYLMTETLPAINQRTYEANYIPLWRAKIFSEWVEEYSGTNSAFISDAALYGMLAKQSSTTMLRFKEDSGILLSLKERNRISNLYALQETWMDEEGQNHASDKWRLPENILYEVVDSRRITDDYGVRIVRITGTNKEKEPAISPSAEQPAFATPEG